LSCPPSYRAAHEKITGNSDLPNIDPTPLVQFLGEALPLGMAIQQFLEALPKCIAAILAKPEVEAYLKRRE
jgi:hypothetical protein